MDIPIARSELFPRIEPHASGRLELDGGHVMYWEECGNPKGFPVLFLHGGPGAGSTPTHRRFFDPDHYRVVLFDQRGAGRSTPMGAVSDNTTQHLIADIETLRRHRGIDAWQMFGGSWGSTLAIAYGEAHPERCLAFVLRGIFLCGRRELDWFLYGIRAVFPEAWRAFAGFLPKDERGDLLAGYWRHLIDDDPAVHMPAARAWAGYEAACSTLLPGTGHGGAFQGGGGALGLARIEAHYFRAGMFVRENQLLENLHRIQAIPTVIVQGRYDMVCPPVTADRLAHAWPEADYVVVPDAGHSAMEPGIRAALIGATERFKSLD